MTHIPTFPHPHGSAPLASACPGECVAAQAGAPKTLRIQDASGRGPWRPGFSSKWVDDERDFSLPPIFEDVPNFRQLVEAAHSMGLHIGCAVSEAQFHQWFSANELQRLRDFGFRVVNATPCKVLARTPTQVVIASPRPLAKLTRLSWAAVQSMRCAA